LFLLILSLIVNCSIPATKIFGHPLQHLPRNTMPPAPTHDMEHDFGEAVRRDHGDGVFASLGPEVDDEAWVVGC
jgi:hypothetical protein